MEINEAVRLAVVNDELQNAFKGFVNDVVENNNVPWFMVVNALAAMKEFVDEKAEKELADARLALTEHYAAIAAEQEAAQAEEQPVAEDAIAIEQE